LWRFLEQQEDQAESYRLLYVATTRAADYLILSDGGSHAAEPRGGWMRLLARRYDLLSGELTGDLPADEPRPCIRVTVEQPSAHKSTVSSRARIDIASLAKAVEQGTISPADLPAVGPVPVDTSARRFYSFSRLHGQLYRDAPTREGAESARSDAIDPLGLGTLVHAVLAEIDFSRPADWQELVGLYAERQLLGAKSGEAQEAARLIAAFVESPRAAQLAAAARSLPEAEFLLAWPMDEQPEPRNLLTGYIDLLYQDDAGDWHLIDFKTNRVTDETVATVAANYEMQMLVYALAAEQSLGTAPRSLVLHFLRGGHEYAFAWTDEARRRAAELVDVAIASATAPPTGH
ncbi:MAG: PD-(D/E)XK nuclease family protein, partial [Pirellulales bacterium]